MLTWTPDWLVVTSLLAIAATCDVVRHRIPNAISVAVAVSGVASSLLRGGWSAAGGSIGAVFVVFGVLLVAWRRKWIGGGDLKLAAGAAAWVGMGGLWLYALASGCALGVLSVISYAASTRGVRREVRANLALAARGVSMPIEIRAGAGRVPVAAGAAFAMGALGALMLGG